MTPAEAAALLGIAAAFDNRKADADAATAWAAALDGLRFEDCRDAIVAHYRASSDWLMPDKVIAGVRRIRTQRVAAHPPIDPPAHLDPDDVRGYQTWLEALRRQIADGEPVEVPAALPSRPMPDFAKVLKSVEEA